MYRKALASSTVALCFFAISACSKQKSEETYKDSSDHKAELGPEREKLLAERLELERQLTKIERQKREALESAIREKQTAEKAQEFSSDELRSTQDQADKLGRLLLSGTHPTGIYSSTGSPLVTLSGDRREVTFAVTVYWKGFLSETPYETDYSFNINKKEGVVTLKVNRDTAVIKIDPQFLRRTESDLKDIFKPGR